MNLYSLPPLAAILANLSVGFYVFYINPKSNLNRLFGLFSLSLALWSLGTYLQFISTSVLDAFFWNRISTLGAVLTSLFLFHFVLVYSKNKFAFRKILLFFLYLSGFLIIYLDFATNLLAVSMNKLYWGYSEVYGPLYPLLSGFVAILTILCFFVSVNLFIRTISRGIKKQTMFFIIAIGVPLVGGIITQVLAPIFHLEIMPLASSLSTVTAIVIAFSIFRHSFIQPMAFSIQKKIAAIYVVFIICLGFASIVTTNIVATENITDEINGDLISLAQSRANHLVTFLSEKKQTVEDFTDIERIERLLTTDKNSSFYEQRLNEANNILYQKKMKNEDVVVLNIIDTNGDIITSTNEAVIHENKKNDELFIKGTTQTFVLDIHYPCEGGNKPVYGISSPIKVENESIGVILVRFSVDPLYEIVADLTGLGETGEVFLVNKTGFMISPSRFYNLSYNLEHIILKQKIETINYQNCMLHKTISESEIETKHDEVTIFEDFRGESRLGSHVYISEMGWALLAEIDESEAYIAIATLEISLLLVMSLLSIFFLILALFHSRKISKPIMQLDSYAKQVAKGDFSVHSGINTSDEIGSLSSSFNTMVASLKTHTEDLESTVSERTSELQQKIEELESFKRAVVGRELRIIELKNQVKQLKDERKMESEEKLV